jgi:hypothetical protein
MVKRYGINADGGLVEAWGNDADAVVPASDYDSLQESFDQQVRITAAYATAVEKLRTALERAALAFETAGRDYPNSSWQLWCNARAAAIRAELS